ncbi:hypothetical protein AB0K62_08920 [Streptomyces halstedii]|uniref:hypothetical protein n=1 Tax=Streptomyces halstedii TaxID=1944 RepID=UPI00346014E6
MPELNTDRVTKHTLVLTDQELASLREAARIALSDSRASEHTKPWQAFVRLGLPATRSLTDAHANPALIGRGDA